MTGSEGTQAVRHGDERKQTTTEPPRSQPVSPLTQCSADRGPVFASPIFPDPLSTQPNRLSLPLTHCIKMYYPTLQGDQPADALVDSKGGSQTFYLLASGDII